MQLNMKVFLEEMNGTLFRIRILSNFSDFQLAVLIHVKHYLHKYSFMPAFQITEICTQNFDWKKKNAQMLFSM